MAAANKLTRVLTALIFFSIPWILPESVAAHAFGATYTLPLPSWIFLYGGTATVALSFLLVVFFVGQKKGGTKENRIDVSTNFLVRAVRVKAAITVGKVLGVALWAGLILAGYLGTQDTTTNISPTFFWVVFLLGFTYLTAILGDAWRMVSPFRTLAGFLEKIIGKDNFGRVKYPPILVYVPAIIFYYLLIYNELLSGGQAAIPRVLSNLILIYSGLNLVGAAVFGREAWFKNGEFLDVFFRLIGKVSPLVWENGKTYLVTPFSRLLNESADSMRLVIFVIFMLASTAFDGFRGTTVWFQWDLSAYDVYSNFGDLGYQIFHALALAFAPVVFLAAYFVAIYGMKFATKNKLSVAELAKRFAFSLIPIALVYNIAHYYTLLITQGQSFISLVSDPLGQGWNLFGSAHFVPNPGIIRADFIWYSQVFFIVAGHVVAVVVSHIIAVRTEKTSRKAILGQLPLLILMVAYTLTGLWILSQPYSFKG